MPRPPGLATALILKSIEGGSRYGLDIVEATGRPSGTVYPTLGRLEKRGLIRGRWEDPKISEIERRPRRRYYELTAQGRTVLAEAIRLFSHVTGDVAEGGAATGSGGR